MRALRLAAVALGTSGLLHILAVALSGFASEALPLLIYALLLPAIAWYLAKTASRLVGWIVFFGVLLLSIGALGRSGGSGPVPDVVIYLIVALDWVCALALFAWLWRDSQSAQRST